MFKALKPKFELILKYALIHRASILLKKLPIPINGGSEFISENIFKSLGNL